MSQQPQQNPQGPPPSADEVLFGAGVKAAQLDVGVPVGGPVIGTGAHPERDYDPLNPGRGPIKHYPSGDVIWGMHVDVQTSLRESATDTGARRIYVDGQRFKEAVRLAVQQAGANGIVPGGILDVIKTGKEPTGTAGLDANTYAARYTTPANAALQQPQAAAPQQQYAPPPVQQQPQQPQQPQQWPPAGAQQPQGWPGQQQSAPPAFVPQDGAQQQSQGAGLDQFAPQGPPTYSAEQLAAARAAGATLPGMPAQ